MNIGSMRNNGVELELNYNPINTKDIQWDIWANMTLPNNKVLKLAPQILNGRNEWLTGNYIFHEGQSRYQLYLVDYAGVDPKTGEALYWAREAATDDAGNVIVENGMTVYKDEEFKTKDYNAARDSNRKNTGNIMPKGYGGFGTSIKAYGFDASVTFAYQFGGRILDYGYQDFMHGMNENSIGMNIHKDLLNAWSKEGDVTDVPRLSTTDSYTNSLSTRFLTSSNYLSLNNVTVGYTFPTNICKKLMIESLRIYCAAENVALWSKRKGLDPRQGFVGSSNDTYSPIRSISGGIRLSF